MNQEQCEAPQIPGRAGLGEPIDGEDRLWFGPSGCDFGDQFVLPGVFAAARGDRWESDRNERIVISSDPVVSFGIATAATVDNHLLAVVAVEDTDRFHERAAVTEPVAWERAIDMAGEEAERAVIAMATTGNCWSDKCAAMPALERFAAIRSPLWTASRALIVERAILFPDSVMAVQPFV